ncbi:hypothetical protein LAJ19_20440 (plasmid) [Deinococcus taeanensis]|uniref:hypothetical protein n=1 Tax=Deinococcus taeanensis TaxID=2737050 RepID=UPI001CDD18B6|nr:hypothetical protein [Deinococcus taeanensis]UBV45181.1 hypothetical protein LAJ19_20440 [Deinococcus taeanensis]
MPHPWQGEVMATTFDVYPAHVEPPTTREVLTLGAVKLWRYLASIDLDAAPRVRVELWPRGRDAPQPLVLDAPFAWPVDHAMCFTVEGIEGGTSAHCKVLETEWEVEPGTHGLPFNRTQFNDPAVFEAARLSGRWWYFRRSAGQPAVVNVLYGCLASALAELTDGVVYSEDHAWDYERFPARSADFDTWFMRPEYAMSEEFRTWASQIQAGVIRELRR